MQSINQKIIDTFWKWFESVSERLATLLDEYQTTEIANIVSPRVKKLSKLVGWEIGPGLKKEYSFSLTFKGKKETIFLVEQIVNLAPKLDEWEINCGRPPKMWDGRFSLRNKRGQTIEIDSSDWSYTLTAFDNNKFFDISLLGKLPCMDEAAKNQACFIVVEGILGERETIEWVDKIIFVESPSQQQLKNATPIKYLRKHIASLICNQ